MKISKKLPIIMVSMALLSSVIVGVVVLKRASNDAFIATEEKLQALSISKKSALSSYLESIQQDLSSLSKSPFVREALLDFKKGWEDFGYNQKNKLQQLYITDNPNPTGSKEELDYAKDGSLYSSYHEKYHPWFRHFLRQKEYYDIFLFDTEGNLVYTVFKELDYATNLEKGEYKDTDLGNAFRAAVSNYNSGKQSFFDFKPYAPSHGAAASFISQPILFENGELAGVLVFQMPISRIDAVMQQNEGMGESGRSYLVGSDKLMRNNLKNEDTILKTKVDTEVVKMALNNELGYKVINSFDGKVTVASYIPFEFMGANFAMISEEDYDEVMQPIRSMQKIAMVSALVVVAIFTVLSILFSRGISSPITKMVKIMRDIADGNSSVEIPGLDKKDEIGEMAKALQVFKENALEKGQLEKDRKLADIKAEEDKKKAMHDLASRFEQSVQGMLNSVAAAATQLSHTAESMGNNVNDVNNKTKDVSNSSGRTSQNVSTVAAASEEMLASVNEISSQVTKSTEVVNDAVKKAVNAESSARSLEIASSEIGSVVKLIRDIAEQINLLALNATIESARAGEAGKGFAVVASEVKNLSNQATRATEDIASQIENVQSISSEVSEALNAIKSAVDKVNEYSGGISAAVEEQTATTYEITKNMQVASQETQEVTSHISDITNLASHAKEASVQMLEASQGVSREAEKLNMAFANFLNEVRHG
ncbi:MAG: methyl-accepting chemotaxis protein [Rickettsiales bacterium]|nr:methyl-accepting chemotaxis protein [Rickettsiales bacterium]